MSDLNGTRKSLFTNVTKPLNDFVMDSRKKIEALEEKVNILEENNEILESNSVIMANKIGALEGIVKNGYKEETCIDGVEINYPSLIEINNKQKEQIESLESENKLLKQIIKEKIKYAIKMSKSLDDPLFSEKFASDSYRERQQHWLKQLEESNTD